MLSARTIYINEKAFKIHNKRFNKFQMRNDVIFVARLCDAFHSSNEIDEYGKQKFATQWTNECCFDEAKCMVNQCIRPWHWSNLVAYMSRSLCPHPPQSGVSIWMASKHQGTNQSSFYHVENSNFKLWWKPGNLIGCWMFKSVDKRTLSGPIDFILYTKFKRVPITSIAVVCAL